MMTVSRAEMDKARRVRLREWFKEYVKTLSCIKCGNNHPAVLDFHHKDGSEKELGVSRLLHLTRSKNRVLKEIAKCEILCANCHRIHHHEARLAQTEEASTSKVEQ